MKKLTLLKPCIFLFICLLTNASDIRENVVTKLMLRKKYLEFQCDFYKKQYNQSFAHAPNNEAKTHIYAAGKRKCEELEMKLNPIMAAL
jgi:hypothetical protein